MKLKQLKNNRPFSTGRRTPPFMLKRRDLESMVENRVPRKDKSHRVDPDWCTKSSRIYLFYFYLLNTKVKGSLFWSDLSKFFFLAR